MKNQHRRLDGAQSRCRDNCSRLRWHHRASVRKHHVDRLHEPNCGTQHEGFAWLGPRLDVVAGIVGFFMLTGNTSTVVRRLDR